MLLRKLFFTLTVVVTLMLSPVYAQQGQGEPVRDIRVVVDISGSMKLNDPDNLRRPAVRLLTGLLPDATGVGLWTFGREVNMLVAHSSLDDGQRNALNAGSEKINSVAQRTNIGGAIEAASDKWFAPGRSLANTHLILLSDGKVDIDPSPARNNAERDRILEKLVPSLASEGLTIHTIALSAEADLDLLGAIADHTGGVAHVAESADELSRIFADTLGQAVPANEVPLDNNRFTVDQGVEEFTALIFSSTAPEDRQLTLLHPDGTRAVPDNAGEAVRWAREVGYDLITVDNPPAGEWQLEGTLGEGSRVTVVSDLRLEVSPIPARFLPGEALRLEAFFTEEGERITDADFLRVINVRLTMTTGDGRQGTRTLSADQPPADGIYRDTISRLEEPGQYQLELEADGGTFSRKFRQTLTLAAPEASGQGPALDGPVETESEPVPEEELEADVAGEGPVDLSELEESAPEPEDPAATPETPAESSEESRFMKDLWPWLVAAGALLLIILGVVLFLLRRRRQSAPDENKAGDTAEAAPAVDPEPEPPVEAEAEPSAEVTEDAEQQDTPPVVEEAADEVADDEPEVTQSDAQATTDETGEADDRSPAEPEPPVVEEAPPVDEPEVTEDEAKAEAGGTEEDVPEEVQDDPQMQAAPEVDAAEQASREDDPGLDDFDDSLLEDEDGDEFGLEDFDLSDIDDLPDLDAEEDENTRQQKPPEDEGKKDG
ncbi:VWA domain-containing protein [Marinobacter bryozoorum]|uniref:VWA domain-containing protein n=1 Tax=Marinobacter bryozoorum TaxID=256324 RepID=UPI002006597F|nr:VWA domain-containing protein [Marinobacter bryozoorum]MCK7544717.1 VWA domain-containing protein [Marinobacter bryozoorum]